MTNPTCVTCRWWKEINLFRRGECRAKSPSYAPAAQYNQNGHTHDHVWPQTQEEDYCGEHATTPEVMHD